MLDLTDLHEQNHRITELSSVFLHLMRDRGLCDTATACDLFFDYVARVRNHLEQVDLLVKKHLYTARDPLARNVARKLVADASLLRRNLEQYIKRWTRAGRREIRIADHPAFVADSEELFELVLDRIQRETEYLYPALRRLDPGDQRAA